jgi:hypothetical protein
VRVWVRRADTDEDARAGRSSGDAARNAALERKVPAHDVG